MTPPSWYAYAARTLRREQRTIEQDPWAYLEDDPTFTRELEQGLADLEAGRGTPWLEIRGEITTESALAGMAEVAHLLRDNGWVAEDMGTGWSRGK